MARTTTTQPQGEQLAEISNMVVSIYAVAMLLVTIICVFLAPETSKTDLHAEDVALAKA